MKLRMMFIGLIYMLSGCSLHSHGESLDLTVQHNALAQHFEAEANQNQIKEDEHKKFLTQFNSKGYVYGKHAADLKAHSQEMIKLYEKIVDTNRKMAKIFREMEP